MTTPPKRNVGGRPRGSRTRPKRVPSPLLRVVGYARTNAGEPPDALAQQEAAIRAHCAAHGFDLVAVHRDENHDGSDLFRAGLTAARDLLWTREADALLVARVDRLTTSILSMSLLTEDTIKPPPRRGSDRRGSAAPSDILWHRGANGAGTDAGRA